MENGFTYVARTKPSPARPINNAPQDKRCMEYETELIPEGMSYERFRKLLKYYYDDTRWMWRDESCMWHLVLNGKEVCSSPHILCYDNMRYSWEDKSGQVHLVHGEKEIVVADSVKSFSMKRYAFYRDRVWNLVHDGRIVASGMDVQSYSPDRWSWVDESGRIYFHGCSGEGLNIPTTKD